MVDLKSPEVYSKLFKKFMELQNWSQDEERENLEFIESIENQSNNQK